MQKRIVNQHDLYWNDRQEIIKLTLILKTILVKINLLTGIKLEDEELIIYIHSEDETI